MWFDFIEQKDFINKLYSNVPELRKIKINKIQFDNEFNDMNIVFEMPEYCVNEPIKWKKQKFNTVVVDIKFCNVYNVVLSKKSSNNIITLEIEKTEEVLNIKLSGGFDLVFCAEVAIIEQVNGYYDELKNS